MPRKGSAVAELEAELDGVEGEAEVLEEGEEETEIAPRRAFRSEALRDSVHVVADLYQSMMDNLENGGDTDEALELAKQLGSAAGRIRRVVRIAVKAVNTGERPTSEILASTFLLPADDASDEANGMADDTGDEDTEEG